MFSIDNLIELSEYLVLTCMLYGYYRYFVRAKTEINEKCDRLEAMVHAQAKQVRTVDLSLIHTGDEMFRLNSAQVGAVEDLTDRVRTHAKHLTVFQLEQQRDIKLIEQDMAGVVQATKAADGQIDDIWQDLAVMDDTLVEHKTQLLNVTASVVDLKRELGRDVSTAIALTKSVAKAAADDMAITDEHLEQIDKNMAALTAVKETVQLHNTQLDELLNDGEKTNERIVRLEQGQTHKERVIEQIRMHLDWIASLKTEFPSLKRPPFSYPKKTELTPEEMSCLRYMLFPSDSTNWNKTNQVLLIPSTKAILDKYFDPEQYAIFTEVEYGGTGYFATQCKTVAKYTLSDQSIRCVGDGRTDYLGFMIKWLMWSVPDIGETNAECELRFLSHVLDVFKTAYNRYKFYKVACEQTDQ